MTTLFVVEANKRGTEHASFNAAMLANLMEACKEYGHELVLFCERTHYEAVISLLPEASHITWRPISVVSGIERRFVRKFSVETRTVFRILTEANRADAAVLMLSMFPNVLATVLLLRPIFRFVRLNILLHIELESLITKEKQSIRREGFWTQLALMRWFKGDWPKFFVLGEGLKSRLLARFPDRKPFVQIDSIVHPYLFTKKRAKHIPTRGKIRIGFVGVGRLVKGVDRFFQLAATLSDEVQRGTLEFVLVGGVADDARGFKNEFVEVLSDKLGGLAMDVFSQNIGSLDCAVFLYRQDYSFTASGAVFDVIDQGVEIFSLENSYLMDLSHWDDEKGILFFGDSNEIAAEIRARLRSGNAFPKYNYAQIKERHAAGARSAVHELDEIFCQSENAGDNATRARKPKR